MTRARARKKLTNGAWALKKCSKRVDPEPCQTQALLGSFTPLVYILGTKHL